MKSVRSRSSTRSISRRPRGSKRHSSTRSACLEKSAKLTPAPSHVAPSGCARPRQTVLGATRDRAGASTGGESLRRNGLDRLRQVAAVGAPAAIALALHGVISEPYGAGTVGELDLLYRVLPNHREAEERHRARPVHRAIRNPHRVEEALRRAEGLLHAGRD